MRAALLLAVFVPLAIVAALFLGRRAVAAVEARRRRLNVAEHIAQIEAENAQLDALNERVTRKHHDPRFESDDKWMN